MPGLHALSQFCTSSTGPGKLRLVTVKYSIPGWVHAVLFCEMLPHCEPAARAVTYLLAVRWVTFCLRAGFRIECVVHQLRSFWLSPLRNLLSDCQFD